MTGSGGELVRHRVGEVVLACRVGGPGIPGRPPVVLLPATGLTSSDWAEVVGLLDPGTRTIAVDLRGHGASTWPGDYRLPAFADDVTGLLDALGLTEVEARVVPDARLARIEAGHLVHAHRPREFAAAVGAFLAQPEPGATD